MSEIRVTACRDGDSRTGTIRDGDSEVDGCSTSASVIAASEVGGRPQDGAPNRLQIRQTFTSGNKERAGSQSREVKPGQAGGSSRRPDIPRVVLPSGCGAPPVAPAVGSACRAESPRPATGVNRSGCHVLGSRQTTFFAGQMLQVWSSSRSAWVEAQVIKIDQSGMVFVLYDSTVKAVPAYAVNDNLRTEVVRREQSTPRGERKAEGPVLLQPHRFDTASVNVSRPP
mmetsp:Transcript_68620/g.127992  ORF Transcript_68620/g.127992 Transcript_68620/m.127992 type:complete len:227 (-) Transcript_68620:28-708(-)